MMSTTSTITAVIIMAVTLLFQSCSSGRGQRRDASLATFVNLGEALGNEKDFLLSELATDIRHIALETSEDILISSRGSFTGDPVILTPEGFLLITQNKTPLHIFDSEGRFIRRIGSIGRGPGEYSTGYMTVYCSELRHIYIKNSYGGDILEFDWEGNLIKKFRAEADLLNFQVIDKGLFLGALSVFPQHDTLGYNYILFNDQGETVKTIAIDGNAIVDLAPEGSAHVQGYIMTPLLSIGQKGININTLRNDTIFTVYKNGDINYTLTWDKGRYTPDFPIHLAPNYRDRADHFLQIQLVTETRQYWYLNCLLEKRVNRILLDKRDGTAFRISRVTNDIDGTLTQLPGFNTRGDQVIRLTDPVMLKKSISSNSYSDEDLKYPEKERAFREMVEALKEDDNPVVTIITFR
ncbi:MAG: 6-bladed beta-propeller [Bacteroidales bacterium]